MQIFNIVEELEKERKKNKELENKLEENHFKIIQLEEENRNILNSYNGIKKDYIKLTRENNKYKEVLNRLKVVYTSMQFSAPENMYTFIEQMGDLLEEINE